MKYKASFIGRKLGAIGKFYRISVIVEGANETEARDNLYKTHEHLQGLILKPVKGG
jgi:hypothetical protein